MKKTAVRFSIAVVIAGSMAPVGAWAAFHQVFQRKPAENQAVQEKREEFRQELKDRREGIKNGVKDKVERLKDRVKEGARGRKSEAETRRNSIIKEDLAKKRGEFEVKANARKEELKKKVGEKRAERIEQFFDTMLAKFEAALGRLEDFADRIEARISTAASAGKDVTKARSELESGRAKIKEAAAELESAKAKYAEAIKNRNVKAAFAEVRKIVQGVAQKVREAHRALVRSVAGLKGIGDGTGTTTPPAAQ